jgi:hypothetical protein
VGVDGIQQRAAAGEAGLGDPLGEVEVADLGIFGGGVGAEGERAEGGRQVNGFGSSDSWWARPPGRNTWITAWATGVLVW